MLPAQIFIHCRPRVTVLAIAPVIIRYAFCCVAVTVADTHMLAMEVLAANSNFMTAYAHLLSYLTILLIIFTLSYFFFYKLITNIHRVKKRHEQELLAEQTKTTTILKKLKDLEEKKYNSIYKHQYV